MQLLADENLPQSLVERLRALGHDVVSVQEKFRGLDDESIAALAENSARLLVTYDKDFGELVFARRMLVAGVVLLRLDGMRIDARSIRVAEILGGDHDLVGQFTVVEPTRTRQRPLPQDPH